MVIVVVDCRGHSCWLLIGGSGSDGDGCCYRVVIVGGVVVLLLLSSLSLLLFLLLLFLSPYFILFVGFSFYSAVGHDWRCL